MCNLIEFVGSSNDVNGLSSSILSYLIVSLKMKSN